MAKDYIGNRKKHGVFGLIFFCIIAFALTFVISYSANVYNRKQKLLKDNPEEKANRLSAELDELFAVEEISPSKAEVPEKVVEAKPETVEEITIVQEPQEITVDVEVSAKPEKAVIPLAEGSIIKNFNTKPEYSDFFEDWRTHTAVDISGNPGDEVRTIADGVIIESYIDPVFGGTMKIDHGAFCSVYMGLDSENMEMNGTVVKRGDTVALLQGIILSEDSKPHLHFEIIENGIYTDPMKYLG